MSYNGFSEKEIKSQWETRRQAGKDGVSKKNFMVLRTPDGKPSNTCVKVAFGCELRDEYAWLLAIQDRAQELISGKKLRIPIPIRVFDGEWEQYLVMRFDENVRTIREIMDENNGLLDAARADRLAAAHAALRQAMDAPKDKSAYVTPFQSTEGWLARGFMFDDLESKRRVKSIDEFLGYLERAFQTAELSIPPLNPITWNHGDPSSYNWGECQDDGHAILTCDKPDFTEPMYKAYKKAGIAIEDDLFLNIEQFRTWHTLSGFYFDWDDAKAHC